MNKKLDIVYKNIADLKSPEYNPRKATPKEEEQIRTSLKEYGFIDPVIVNVNPERKNIIVGGNRRIKVYEDMGGTEVPCIEVDIESEEREKELNLRLNKNTGSWDPDKFTANFSKDMMLKVGFAESELTMYLDEMEQKINSITNKDAAYPLVPKFSEKHDAIIIVSKSSIDTNYLEQVLGLEKHASYKNQRVGKTHIIDVEKFKEEWEK